MVNFTFTLQKMSVVNTVAICTVYRKNIIHRRITNLTLALLYRMAEVATKQFLYLICLNEVKFMSFIRRKRQFV